jgi:hypothetical protein
MTFEEMQTILAGVVTNQAAFSDNMELMRQDIANTQAIANSNARAIEAVANQQTIVGREIAQFVQAVAEYSAATERRLTALEDRQ